MRKLILNEDDAVMAPQAPAAAPEVIAVPAEPVIEQRPVQEADKLSVSNLINQMIKGEWDAIDLYNSVATTLELQGNAGDVVATIKDIVKEEYVHVGQLEKVLQSINPDATKIAEGEQEASNQLANPVVQPPMQAAASAVEVTIR